MSIELAADCASIKVSGVHYVQVLALVNTSQESLQFTLVRPQEQKNSYVKPKDGTLKAGDSLDVEIAYDVNKPIYPVTLGVVARPLPKISSAGGQSWLETPVTTHFIVVKVPIPAAMKVAPPPDCDGPYIDDARRALRFRRPLTRDQVQNVTVVNVNTLPVLFRLSVTSVEPNRYTVDPPVHYADFGKEVTIKVKRQASENEPDPDIKCNDHFLLESVLVPPSVTPSSLTPPDALITLWQKCVKHPGTIVRTRALGVEFIGAAPPPPPPAGPLGHRRFPVLSSPDQTEQEKVQLAKRHAILRSVRIGP